MTTERSANQGTTRSKSHNGGSGAAAEGRDPVEAAMREARGALEGVSRSMPELARASRGAMDDAIRAIEAGSDERLSAGVTMSLGLAIGLLIGGAPRLLVAVALVPLVAMGLTMVDRRSQATGTATRPIGTASRAAG